MEEESSQIQRESEQDTEAQAHLREVASFAIYEEAVRLYNENKKLRKKLGEI